jgi:hypothetical protein
VKSKVFVAALFACLLLMTATAYAAHSSSGASLTVTWPQTAATADSSSTPYVVSGCGYAAANGGVTVVAQSPTALAFAGQVPDAGGCISLSNFAADGPGHYTVTAYQTVHNRKVALASTSFDR